MKAPSLSGLYVNAWKCIECCSLCTRSSFLKCTKHLVAHAGLDDRAGDAVVVADAARLGSGFFQPGV